MVASAPCTASISGQSGNKGQSNYAATKAGIIAATKCLAQEYGRWKILCNVVSPGFIDTEMTRGIPGEVLERYLERIPLGRAGTAEDVAATVLFLASPGAGYLTGQSLGVNGGLYTGD